MLTANGINSSLISPHLKDGRNLPRLFSICLLFVSLAVIMASIAFTTFMLWNDELTTAREFNFETFEKVPTLWPGRVYSLQSCCEHSAAAVSMEGTLDGAAGRFEVRDTDPLVKGSQRSEVRLRPNPFRTDLWFQARVLLPADWTPDTPRTIVMQWHGTRDVHLAEPGIYPPLELAAAGNEWHLVTVWDTRMRAVPIGESKVEGRETVWTGEIRPGTWENFTFHIRWSHREDGLLELWRGEDLVLSREGPNALNDLIGPYLKFGAYAPDWKAMPVAPNVPTRIVFFDHVIASSREISRQP